MLKNQTYILFIAIIAWAFQAKSQSLDGLNVYTSTQKMEQLMQLETPQAIHSHLSLKKFKTSFKNASQTTSGHSYLVNRYMSSQKDLMINFTHKANKVLLIIELFYLSAGSDFDAILNSARLSGYKLTNDDSENGVRELHFKNGRYSADYTLKKDLQCQIIFSKE